MNISCLDILHENLQISWKENLDSNEKSLHFIWFLTFQTFGMTAKPSESLLLLSLEEGVCMSHICFRERHFLGSFNPVLVNFGLNECWGNLDHTSAKSVCLDRLLLKLTLALALGHLLCSYHLSNGRWYYMEWNKNEGDIAGLYTLWTSLWTTSGIKNQTQSAVNSVGGIVGLQSPTLIMGITIPLTRWGPRARHLKSGPSKNKETNKQKHHTCGGTHPCAQFHLKGS